MARKKPKGDGKKQQPRKRPPLDLPPREVIEGQLRQLLAGMTGEELPDTPLAQAQELMYDAFEEPDPRRRVELAQEALRISPDCADAHVVLADEAPSRKEALAHYRQAVAAGERALGPEYFQDAVGDFWGILETRPYMRARLGLAMALWHAAKRDEAVEHLREMLRLNPNDNQGVRYTLAGFLLYLDRDDELTRLLDQYGEEHSAAWDYTRALVAFRKDGDIPATRKLLQQAIKTNRHVPAYLTGTKFPPSTPPAFYSPGDESEALEYINGFLPGWKSTPGAVAWLRASTTKSRPEPKAKGPGAAAKKLLNKLPQEKDVWQCGFRMLPTWMFGEGDPLRPWATLVTSQTDGTVLGHHVSEVPPGADLLWDTLAAALRKPAASHPHRPTTLQVQPDERWENLRPHLEEVGITVEELDNLDEFDAAFESLADHMRREGPPGLVEMPGATPERVGAFFDAAAEFFRQAPWKRVGFESAIRIECDRLKGGPWFAVLMGQSGLTTGVALYEDYGLLQRMWSGEADDEMNASESVALSLIFSDAWDIAVSDLDEATARGWPVARSDAYPMVLRKERGMSMRLPEVWELELMEGSVRAIPGFVQRRDQDDSTPETLTVPTAGGPLKLTLAWVVEE